MTTKFRLPSSVTVALIEEVKNNPVLWKGDHEKYGDRFCTAAAWKTIARKLKISDNILKGKWKNLRNIFRLILKNKIISELEEYDGKWKYFHLMGFLKCEFRDEEDSVEFIVDTDQETSTISNSPHNSNGDAETNTVDKILSKRNCPDTLSDESNDEGIIQHIDGQEYEDIDDHKYYRNNNVAKIPTKRAKSTDSMTNYDVMYLRSLAPYFKQLEPFRKLVVRSKIQDLLLNEISKQNSVV